MKKDFYSMFFSLFIAGIYFLIAYGLSETKWTVLHLLSFPMLLLSAWFVQLFLLEMFPEKKEKIIH